MGPSVRLSRRICCVCGKKKSTHAGVRLHLFPSNVKRRREWVRNLNVAYVKRTQVVCEDHFEPCHIGTKGHLLSNAVPRPTNTSEDQDSSGMVDANVKESFPGRLDATVQYSSHGIRSQTQLSQNVAEDGANISYDLQSYDVYASDFGRLEGINLKLPSPLPLHVAEEPSLSGGHEQGKREGMVERKQTEGDVNEVGEKKLSIHHDVEYISEDTEYSSGDDHAFWEMMEIHTKQKGKKWLRNKPSLKYSSHRSNFENEKKGCHSRNSHMEVQECNDQQPSLTKEGNKTSDKISSVVKRSENEDDWITDNEVDDDDDDENIDLAFKREWKEKRHPHNSKEKNFVCEICGKRLSKHSFLRKHIVRDHKDHEVAKRYPYSCQHCKKVYVREKDLLQHHQQYRGPCEVCGKMMKCSDLFVAHRRNHDACVCKMCNKEFLTKTALYGHMRLKHSQKTFPCPTCGRKFSLDFVRKKHVAKGKCSPGQTRYTCDTCDFWTVSQGYLKIHQRAHSSKIDLFTCKECKSTFNTKSTYKKHVATHVNKSSIVCPLSSEKFTSESELETHRISHPGPTTTNIVDSGKKTISSHFDSSYVSQYTCGLCNTTLGDDDVSQHMHKYHDMDIDTPRDIRLEVERVHLSEIDENTKSMVQVVCNEETNGQELDKPMNIKHSTDFGCSSGKSALLVPTNAVPPNVNLVEVNGVQYHVIRETQQH